MSDKGKYGLGANLTVKNEEGRILRQHLENLKEFCDEIVVTVDRESTDRTLEICREYTDLVFEVDFPEYDDRVRRAGSAHLTTPWELWVDADFIFPKETQEEILAAISSDEKSIFEIPSINFVFGKWLTEKKFWYYHIRLFEREKVSYERIDLHNWKFDYPGEKGSIQNPILHYGFPSVDYFIQNLNRYTTYDDEALGKGTEGGLFQRRINELKADDLVNEPLEVFDRFFNNYAYHQANEIGAIFSWLQAFYSFTEKAKRYEHQLKEESDYSYGKIDTAAVMQEIRKEAGQHLREKSLKRRYHFLRILRGITPPYLYKALNRLLRFDPAGN